MRTALATIAVSIVSIVGTAVADESMRCGKWVVTSAATVQELLEKCGPPSAKEVSTQDIYAPGAQPGRTHKVGVSTTERWIYDRGKQAFRMVATVIDGKLASIDRAE